MAESPVARLTGVAAGYGRAAVLSGVDLDLPAGAVTALVGVNGSGKTTLLRVLLGLLRPRAGRVERPAGAVGYVPQVDRSEVLLPVTARQVVLMGCTPGLALLARTGARERTAADAALARFDLGDLADRRFTSLSGGQRQRVMLARALVAEPRLLVLDEPVRGLDLASAARLVAILHDLAHGHGLAVVVATHSLDLVANHADQVALFKDGAVSAGPVSEILTHEVLSRYLDEPVHVGEVAGHRVVVPGDAP
jgi:ABC-type Mn2+/Zn2+ transport system ATPase subunit